MEDVGTAVAPVLLELIYKGVEMIKILNVSHEKGIAYGKGEQIYHLFINDKKAVNITYRHNYEDGLAVCLEKAAKAVRLREALIK